MTKEKNKLTGFTLIEVLIALLILGIALVAIVKVTGDNVRNLAARRGHVFDKINVLSKDLTPRSSSWL